MHNNIISLAHDSLMKGGAIGERTVKALHFFLKDQLKLDNYSISVFTPAAHVHGEIVIDVKDSQNKPLRFKPKQVILDNMSNFLGISSHYTIRFK